MAEKFKNIEIKNKKASFEYFLLQKYEAGIILKGTEIKAIRLGAANLTDAFCYIRSGEVFVKTFLYRNTVRDHITTMKPEENASYYSTRVN